MFTYFHKHSLFCQQFPSCFTLSSNSSFFSCSREKPVFCPVWHAASSRSTISHRPSAFPILKYSKCTWSTFCSARSASSTKRERQGKGHRDTVGSIQVGCQVVKFLSPKWSISKLIWLKGERKGEGKGQGRRQGQGRQRQEWGQSKGRRQRKGRRKRQEQGQYHKLCDFTCWIGVLFSCTFPVHFKFCSWTSVLNHYLFFKNQDGKKKKKDEKKPEAAEEDRCFECKSTNFGYDAVWPVWPGLIVEPDGRKCP